jgi:hypothetical protein
VCGEYHVPRLVSDPEFEEGVAPPVCVSFVCDDAEGGARLPLEEAKAAVAGAVTAAVAGLKQGAAAGGGQ